MDLKAFKSIEFSQHGVPLLILELMSFLTKESRNVICEKKVESFFPGLLAEVPAKEPSEFQEERFHKEAQMITLAKMNYQGQINFDIYEQFFRFFCVNKYVDNIYMLMSTRASFRRGIRYWYGGRDNQPLADIIFNYIGRGIVNHVITLSEFVSFTLDLTLSNSFHNSIVFNMISDRKVAFTILDLLRAFVSTPKGCTFSTELILILEYYVEKTLR